MRAALVALMFFYYSRGGNSSPVPLSPYGQPIAPLF